MREDTRAGHYDRHGRYVEPARPQLVVEDNPEVGRLYGPDERLVRIVRAKPEHPIGFHPEGVD